MLPPEFTCIAHDRVLELIQAGAERVGNSFSGRFNAEDFYLPSGMLALKQNHDRHCGCINDIHGRHCSAHRFVGRG